MFNDSGPFLNIEDLSKSRNSIHQPFPKLCAVCSTSCSLYPEPICLYYESDFYKDALMQIVPPLTSSKCTTHRTQAETAQKWKGELCSVQNINIYHPLLQLCSDRLEIFRYVLCNVGCVFLETIHYLACVVLSQRRFSQGGVTFG